MNYLWLIYCDRYAIFSSLAMLEKLTRCEQSLVVLGKRCGIVCFILDNGWTHNNRVVRMLCGHNHCTTCHKDDDAW